MATAGEADNVEGQGATPLLTPDVEGQGATPPLTPADTAIPLAGLTKQTAAESPPPPPPPNDNNKGSPSAVVPYSDDATRRNVAYILLYTLIGVIGVEMLASLIFSQDCWSNSKSCQAASSALGLITGTLNSIFTAIVGLVGSVVGFYFGSKSK